MEVVSRLGRLPVAAMLIPVLAISAMWADNLNRLSVENAWPTLASAAVIASAVVVLFRPFAGSWSRAAIFGAIAAAYCFYAPPVIALLALPRWAEVLVHLIVIAGAVCLARRVPSDAARAASLSGKLNLLVLCLLAGTLIPVAMEQARASAPRDKALQSLGELEARTTPGSPDVWHIIFDRYAGIDTLRSAYAFDNRPFLDGLRSRGFTVRERAYSNYQRTGHSVSSTLNGRLLDPMAPAMAERPADWVPLYRAMRDSASTRAFKKSGYQTVFAGSWWEPTRFSNAADRSITFRAVPELARLAITRSALGFWTAGVSMPFLDGRRDQCLRAKDKFDQLRRLASSGQRKQVFAHFLVPHPPFVVNADGSCRSLAAAQAASRRDNYVGQVEFVNRQALALVDAILKGPRPAVIVIQSDEGPWPEPYVGNEDGLGTDPVSVPWTELSKQSLRDKMAILLAVRGPSGPVPTMPESPVQIYPAILHDYFGASGPIPASRHYVFAGDRKLYDFKDVTDQLLVD